MKKHLFLLLSGLFITLSAFSQQPEYGFKFGINNAIWSIGEPNASFQNKFRMGLITGVNADIPVSGQIGVQTELLYAMFGSTFTDEGDFAKYKVNYLLVPVMGRYNFPNGFSVMAGPQFGLLLSAKSNIDGNKHDFKDDMKKTDIFFAVGGEYKLPNGLLLGLRYQHGLTNTEKDADVNYIKNRGFSLTVTYKLKQSIGATLDELFK